MAKHGKLARTVMLGATGADGHVDVGSASATARRNE